LQREATPFEMGQAGIYYVNALAKFALNEAKKAEK